MTKLTPFKTSGQKPNKRVTIEDSTLIVPLLNYTSAAEKMSDSTPSSSHPSHLEQHFHPVHPHHHHMHSSHPETLVSPAAEDHTAQRLPAFIQPQDVNTQLTTGLAALVQETSPPSTLQNTKISKKKGKTSLQHYALSDMHQN